MGVHELKDGKKKVVTIFGSSRPIPGDAEYQVAYAIGRELAAAGFTVCNGGYKGTMEASARGAKEAGGSTLGIVAESFAPRTPNQWIDTAITKSSLIDRMLELIDRGDAYVVLKGGTGTLLELAAVWELMNKTLLAEKPIVIVGGFWSEVVHTLKDELAWEGLEKCTRYVLTASDPADAARILAARLSA
jgi:uncharacterized protein (TIGR00725 family)